jgi:peptidoglycan/LPS O-acetylase OafA/YrhL
MFFANINFLRAFAALLVLFYHVIELGPWAVFPIEGSALVLRVGWVGVDLFFVISGFVIGLSLLRLYRGGGPDYRSTFMRRRLARIVPLYVFTGAVFLFLVEPGMLLSPWIRLAARVGSHLVFLHNLHPGLHSSINGANWSVAAEMQFYVLAILAVPLLSRARLRWILAWGLLVAWCSRALAYWLTRDLANPHITFVYATQVPAMLDEFAIGVCIARLYADGTMQRFAQRHRALTTVAITVCLAGALQFVWRTYWAHPGYWDNPWMVIFWRTGLALAFGALVLLAAQLPDLTRLWPLRPLNYLGEISYGIYLWHLPVILSLRKVVGGDDPQSLLALTLVGVCTLSALTWHLFEKPIIERFR